MYQRLLADGHLSGTLDDLALTAMGTDVIARVRDLLRDWLLERLDGVDDSDPEAVSQAISTIAQRAVIERVDTPPPPPAVVLASGS